MIDPAAYRRRLLARLLQLAGAGTAGLAAVAAVDCGARSDLPGPTRSGGGATSGTGGAGGAGGAGGGGGAGGSVLILADASPATTGVTIGAGGGFPDGGLVSGMVCIPMVGKPSECPAVPVTIPGGAGICWMLVSVVSGPSVENNACCYEVVARSFPCYVGRTFFVDEGIVKAELRAGRSWRAGSVPEVSAMPAATRRALAEAWARDGLFEHASVASFSRFAMELLALGAPADLVRDTHAAAVDEVRHAELCLGLASAYFGESVEPAALPVPGPLVIEANLATVAAEAVMEGCIGETVATVQALDALAAATDPAVREVLEVTVADETRHAELAWRFVAWAIDEGGAPVREAVQEAFAGFRPPVARVEDFEGVDLAIYAEHGRQRAVEGRAIAERAMTEILQPAMCVLLSRGVRAERA